MTPPAGSRPARGWTGSAGVVALGIGLALVPVLLLRTAWAGAAGAGVVALVVAGLRWPAGWPKRRAASLPPAPPAAAGLSVALTAAGVLLERAYAPVAALLVGVLGYAYLAAADAGRRPVSARWWASIGLFALAGGGLSAVVLLAAAAAPTLPGWAVVGGLLAALVATVLALG